LAFSLSSSPVLAVYGIMACHRRRRVNEIGIRMALGAQASQVLLMILRETAWLAAIGVGTGLGAALLAHAICPLNALRPEADRFTHARGRGIAAVCHCYVAGWGPANKASLIQPMQALRHE